MDSNLAKKVAPELHITANKRGAKAKLGQIQSVNETLENAYMKLDLTTEKSKDKKQKAPTLSEEETAKVSGMKASWSLENVDGFFVPKIDVSKLTLIEQERHLVRDLIYAFSGVPTTFIRPDAKFDSIEELNALNFSEIKFKINENFNSSIRALAHDLLPLIKYFIIVQNFAKETVIVARNERIHQLIAAEFDDYISEYYELLSHLEIELESDKLNIKKLVYVLSPVLSVMKTLANLTQHLRQTSLNSGQIFNYLQQLYEQAAGNEHILKCLQTIMVAVYKPYMNMVASWMQRGILNNVHYDFFIEDTAAKIKTNSPNLVEKCAEYWSMRYTIHKNRIPKLLEKYAQNILNSGKYVNILHQLEAQFNAFDKPIEFSIENRDFLDIIHQSYDYAAKTLLQLFFEKYNLMDQLFTIKQYISLQFDEFTEGFLNAAAEELSRTVDFVEINRLQALLRKTLHTTRTQLSAYKKNVCCEFKMSNLVEQLADKFSENIKNDGGDANGAHDDDGDGGNSKLHLYAYEAFVLKYNLEWPLTYVLNADVQEKLQILFREIFFLKYVKHSLKKLSSHSNNVKVQTASMVELGQRMLYTIQNLDYYITDVLESNWANFMKSSKKAENIDQFITDYNHFLNSTLKMSLLDDSAIVVRSIFTLGNLCLNYVALIDDNEHDVLEFDTEFNDMVCVIMELIAQIVHTEPNNKCRILLKRLQLMFADEEDKV